ncbi:hypothetical protein [Actinoplanes friuliensis]|uniref:Uncharacterized protein n=1 Tax=Actinoplanes friuliensis DSM 7358 TaxID=1246995 RepID=U5WCL9_9ACTN|nr:hypothetical protein [Actinoplanes friuliensis]AGZ46717.1 hypothetical protein AFR_42315 [Actinoplanes friuliensis DSM 7358]
MRRSLVLPLTALVGVAAIVPISVAAASSTPPKALDVVVPPPVEERFGVVRYDTAAQRWGVLNNATFQSSGLGSVSCSSSTGILTVGFTPLGTIGTFTVDEDDAYAGRYDAGAALTTRSMAITFRKATTGAVVKCNASELRIANSSLQVWVKGAAAVPPTTVPTSPTRPGPASPTAPPTETTGPPTPPPTTQPTITPPTIDPGTDPEDTPPAFPTPPPLG